MSRTYRELIDQTKVNFEFWTGDIQNRGLATMTMSVVGTPKFQRIGKVVGLSPCITSGAVASPIDITGTVSFELVLVQRGILTPTLLSQTGATGGYTIGSPFGMDRIEFYTLDAVGAGARLLYTPTWSLSMHDCLVHVVLVSIAGATSGLSWIDNVPLALTSGAPAGTSANPPASVITVLDADSQKIGYTIITRAWQGALDSSEVNLLYQNYRNLVVPSKV